MQSTKQPNNQTTKQQNNQTTRQLNDYTIRFVWKTIPRVARVTRDGVSGYMKQMGTAVWKTVPTDYQKPITDNRQPKVYYGSLKDIKIIAKHCITVA